MSRTYTITLALAFTALAASGANRRLSYDELAAGSDKVVLGTVGVKRSHYGDGGRIYTDIVVSPDVTIKGAEEGSVVVQTLGGTVGDVTMSVSDGPEMPDGQRVVVFLKREADHYVVVGRSGGSVAVSSAEAAAALDGALLQAGPRQANRRGMVELFMNRTSTNAATQSAAAAQVGCYSTDGAKWPATSAAYKIGTSIPAAWTASIDASAATWSGAGVAFRLVNDAASVNELSYLDLVGKYGASYSNTYAVTTTWSSTSTGRISKATIEVNTKWQWSTTGAANMADVQNILTHEFGHWMRLLDIYSPAACGEVTMWGTASLGETKKRTLDQVDIDGFASLYGLGSGTPLGTPGLSAPANGATGVTAAPVLTWSAATGANSYDVYFGTAASPGLVGNVTGTSFQPGTLTAGVTYFWRVVAKNAAGSTAGSGTYSFTVASSPGSGPALLSPANGATGVATTTVMSWSAVPGAVGYDLYVGTTSNPGKIGSLTGTSVTVRGFRAGTVYYWKVVARTGSGSVSSAVASFRTN